MGSTDPFPHADQPAENGSRLISPTPPCERLHLKTYDEDDEPFGLLEIITSFEDIFLKSKSHGKRTGWSSDGLGLLLTEIARYPLLTARQERAILLELASISVHPVRKGNRTKSYRIPVEGSGVRYRELRDQLVVHNLRLCFFMAKRYASCPEELLDLFQESVLGLLRAIDLVDVTRNLRFSTYAYQWIRQAITRWIVNCRNLIRLPAHIHDLPAESRPHLTTVSIDELESVRTFELVDSSLKTPLAYLEDADLAEIIYGSLRSLDVRAASVVEHRFGLNGFAPKTLEEVAHIFGVTRERIRQIEGKALDKLHFRLFRRIQVLE